MYFPFPVVVLSGGPELARSRYLVTDSVGPELPDVLALADVVISRSGAGTIAELTALGKPSVLIPLATSAGNEQEHNALHVQQAGAAVALVQKAVTPDGLRAAVGPILASPEQCKHMAQQARSLGRPDAGDRLTEMLLDVATG
ncbi:UDP-N-acetylglucosamine--N-acetylmuramyl-(pentapeptide) pyrophosphoryl-undecaprenol N-acetylglucosamine transferase [Streptomyces tibetensis]|uniref:UDP-N-acetylglucosamine--N-acetylmuramyl- (pentapeptide) pyrophosphoryl-undecaprenol N-acetylglucosamine transferase n=1 Tax=Streptomyces tibetensis TaxID=2382123 RepID=UPI003F4CD5D9